MKKLLGWMALSAMVLSAPALAKGPKSYQVTGEVVSADSDVVVVTKGKEKWEIARGKVDKPELKAGDKVTVFYTMTAESFETKGAKADGSKAEAKSDGGKAAAK